MTDSNMEINMHQFGLRPGQTIHIGGIPYKHVGGGVVRGATNPVLAHGGETADMTLARIAGENPDLSADEVESVAAALFDRDTADEG